MVARLTDPGDGGVFILDLVGGAEHLLDVHVVAERRRHVPSDAGDRLPIGADEPLPA